MSNKRISICMIVRDEEANLPGCLDSVASLADEIVVVDTGSTDRTREIAARHGARLFTAAWQDDFSAARNVSLEQATGEWILVLDADERIPSAEQAKIRRLTRDPSVHGYFVRLRCPTHRSVEWGHQCRLFRNCPWIRYKGPVHEQVMESLLARNATVRLSDVVIEHLGYLVDDQRLQAKWDRNLRILERHVADHPDDLYSLYQLGRQWVMLNRPDRGREILERVRQRETRPFLLVPILNDLALVSYQYFGDGTAAREWATRSLELIPDQTFPWIALGMAWRLLEKPEKALECLSEAEKRERAGLSTPAIASEIHIEPIRISLAILDLLPAGSDREDRRREILEHFRHQLSPETDRIVAAFLDEGVLPGESLAEAGNPADLERIITLLPYLPEKLPVTPLAEVLFRSLEAGSHRWSDPVALRILLEIFLDANRIVLARKTLRSLSRCLEATGRITPYIETASRLRQRGHDAYSLALLEAGRERYPDDGRLALALGLDYLRRNNPQAAIPPLQTASRAFPDLPEILYHLAVAALGAHQPEEARRIYARLEAVPDGEEWRKRLPGLPTRE